MTEKIERHHNYSGVWKEGLNQLYTWFRKSYPDITLRTENGITALTEDVSKAKEIEEKKLAALGVIEMPVFETQCDTNGNFILKNIPYGNYGIVTTVTWTNGEYQQGGKVGKEIIVDDHLQRIYITDQLRYLTN